MNGKLINIEKSLVRKIARNIKIDNVINGTFYNNRSNGRDMWEALPMDNFRHSTEFARMGTLNSPNGPVGQ